MLIQNQIEIQTHGRALVNISGEIAEVIIRAGVVAGMCHVFLHHTSASLIITENADPNVHYDLERFMNKLVIDGNPEYRHGQEGKDDMAAHIRSVLTQSEISLPVAAGKPDLGTWQSLYLWEHRYQNHRRRLTISLFSANT